MFFRGKYSYLSNFYKCKVKYNGFTFDCSETAYQAQKTTSVSKQLILSKLPSTEVKKLMTNPNNLTVKKWDDVKDEIMYKVVKEKFKQNKELKTKLLATGNTPIIEDNNFGETYWGICNGVGLNKLGKIIEKVRRELSGRPHSIWDDI